MTQRVVLRQFSSRGDAEIVRELLVANGIDAYLSSDDCGSVDPALAFARGVQLLVSADDLSKAKQVIASSTKNAKTGVGH